MLPQGPPTPEECLSPLHSSVHLPERALARERGAFIRCGGVMYSTSKTHWSAMYSPESDLQRTPGTPRPLDERLRPLQEVFRRLKVSYHETASSFEPSLTSREIEGPQEVELWGTQPRFGRFPRRLQ